LSSQAEGHRHVPAAGADSTLVVVGGCPRCGVQCAGRPEDGGRLGKMLDAHAQHCVGSSRAGELWVPFGRDLPPV
jgi:hypothetical protein